MEVLTRALEKDDGLATEEMEKLDIGFTYQGDQIIEPEEETEKGFLAWLKVHKKQLALAGISIATIIGIVIGIRSKDEVTTLWRSLSKRVKKIPLEKVVSAPAVKMVMPTPEDVSSKRPYTTPTEPFGVIRHVRTMAEGWHHSPEKAAEAAELGIELLPNQTLVGPYIKGAA